jgi:hypothetical protein
LSMIWFLVKLFFIHPWKSALVLITWTILHHSNFKPKASHNMTGIDDIENQWCETC